MTFLAAPGSCQNQHAGPLDDFCGFVDEHVHSNVLLWLLSRLLWPLLVFVVVLVVARIVRRLLRRTLEESAADAQVRTLVDNVLLGTGVAVAIAAGLYAAGFELGIFLTIGGLSTLAIGLAFQDLLRNVLAGIFLLLERPFRIGDVITVDTLTGSVETIELRTTCLRLADGRLAVIPNLDAFNKSVVNASAFPQRQFTVTLWVPAGANLELVLRSARAALESLEEAASTPAPRVQPAVDIDGGVTLQCQYWLDYRSTDPDAVAARLVRMLAAAVSEEGDPQGAVRRIAAETAPARAQGAGAEGDPVEETPAEATSPITRLRRRARR